MAILKGSVRLMNESTRRTSPRAAPTDPGRSSRSIAVSASRTASSAIAGHSWSAATIRRPSIVSSGRIPSKYLPIMAVTRLAQLPSVLTRSVW